jgi:diguanylate cyclase (GGDEF)-like protein/PAS domain S-box-containing protein
LNENSKQDVALMANAIYDNDDLIVLMFDAEGRIIDVNKACEHLSGYSFNEIHGKTFWETFIPPEGTEVSQKDFLESFQDSRSKKASYFSTLITHSGERRQIQWSISLIHDDEEKLQHVVAVGMDITECTKAASKLQQSWSHLIEAQRIAKIGSWSLDLQRNKLEWSDEIFNLFEIDQKQFGSSYEAFLDAIHPEDREVVNQAYTDSLASKKPYTIDHRLLFSDGRIKYVREACETRYDDKGNPVLSQGTVQNITEQKEAEQQLGLYASVFLNSPDATLITDQNNCIIAVNPALTELTGYTLKELEGVNPNIMASGLTPHQTYQEMSDALEQQGYWQGELIDRAKDGKVYPKWTTIAVIRDENGQIINHIICFYDITERKAAEERIHYLAHHDTLTGLFNRFSLENRLGQAVVQARRTNKQIAVLFIDLDRFKNINDSLGHQIGDQFLKEVAKRLESIVRESDIVARLGGDEFVVVLTNLDDTKMIARLTGKMVETLREMYVIEDHEIRSSSSIGVSIFPGDGEDVESLMKAADVAMYHAKEQGRNNYQFFTTELNEDAHDRVALERDLRNALENHQFELYYQPKWEAASGKLIGVEALIRWNHPQRGLVPPMKFIPIAEEVDLISELGEWVLNEASRQLSQWHQQGLSYLKMAINLSPKQLRNPALIDRVSTVISSHGIGEGMLEIEVTETAAMSNAEYAIQQLVGIRDIGVTLAIDDFGTGYSSLAYLKSFPIQTLKLDRSYVSGIETDPNDTAICAATIALAHNLGLTVVAEGVETERQRDFLVKHGCDILQGYLLSRPLPADEVEKIF